MIVRRARRRLMFSVAAGTLVVLIAAGTWAMALRFESPAQREAAASAPTPRPITADVRQGDLARVVSFRASIVRDSTVDLQLAPRSDRGVVTGDPLAAGQTITAGAVVTEVNGRPVFGLPGEFPLYRVLRPGDSGPDVRQLQRGLTEAGHSVVADGIFGEGTERAISALYVVAGYNAPSEPAATSADGSSDEDASSTNTASERRDHAAQQETVVDPAEFVIVPSLPATIAATPKVGTEVSEDTKITVQNGALRLRGNVPPLSAVALKGGMRGTATGQTGSPIAVHVAAVGSQKDDESAVPVSATFDSPASVLKVGAEMTISVRVQTVVTGSLIVPTVAVASGGSGASHLLVQQKDGSFQRISIREIGQLNGESAVEPEKRDELHAGDRVRVGRA
jgi:peptidoglycan hydrolase-like protein with peptidoglycan-binding domain